MHKLFAVVLALALSLSALPAFAGSPHFVAASASTAGNVLTVSAKEAGLGDEAQIVVVVTADAACVNNGGNHPKAVNKGTFSSSSTVPVQNGKADYSVVLTAVFSPDCSPPMTVVWSNILVQDTTNGLSVKL